jgi:ATP-dependent helicase YprA (DUF1998 family)
MQNPITYTEKVVSDFLKYQLSTYAFADTGLHAQLRQLLSLEETRNTPLLKGPYISLSRAFRQGASYADLAAESVFHSHIQQLSPHPHSYGHQEEAYRAIKDGMSTLVATGTGSGKTECFLMPIISRCLELRDQEAPESILAVIVYPMNALAEDQLLRMRSLLAGTGVSFGMYIGKTPNNKADANGVRLSAGSSSADYEAKVHELRERKEDRPVYPFEERPSREEMREEGKQPRILLTNVKQLELLLTRQRDLELFDNALLEYLVFDEAHTFTGAQGAETACLIRRLRVYCGKSVEDTVCVATSATIADPEKGIEAGREFASRFFGVDGANVALIGERYEDDDWATSRVSTPALPGDPVVQLNNALTALEAADAEGASEADAAMLKNWYQTITGTRLPNMPWREAMFEVMRSNEVIFQIAMVLSRPRALADMLEELENSLGRAIFEEEVLAWLALGAAAQRDGRSLLRPVVHGFVRGVGGAVVTFPERDNHAHLWLSAEEAENDRADLHRLPILSCTTCGQHYFEHWLEDFSYTGMEPGGGQAVDDSRVWKVLDRTNGGTRAVSTNHITSGDEEEDNNEISRSERLFYCRHCGAVNQENCEACLGCGREEPLVPLSMLQQHEDHPGYLHQCRACGAHGRRFLGQYREPARPVRATPVADVHVLAHSLIQHAERKRLLVFADNRQDAAFQAGWMQDHSRRYRFRELMYQHISVGPVSVGDLTTWLDEQLERDDELSRALVPEVWRVARKESAGSTHENERKRFLRIQVLRELVMGSRQRIGLEPWGRLRVDYVGLDVDHPIILKWANELGCRAEALKDGVALLLDAARSRKILFDAEGQVFSKFWLEGEKEISRGYLPLMQDVPSGVKFERDGDDHTVRIKQWWSKTSSIAKQAAKSWGVSDEDLETFLREIWQLVTNQTGLMMPVTLRGARGNALPRTAGAHQVDADKLLLTPHQGFFQCDTCRRLHLRTNPTDRCMAWRCEGTLVWQEEPEDNYDLLLLDQEFSMMKVREHSAQIPGPDRERIERQFKDPNSSRLNTLVCTPTLELGVDIGGLDAVLMRNVPPLPANYWQRAGRAGRRHRMALDVTYARGASHDRAYFNEPLKMLEGKVRPPSFNLKNGVMLSKHIHATVLTTLFQMAREQALSAGELEELDSVLQTCFPPQIKPYLFDASGNVRPAPLDVSALGAVIAKHRAALLERVKAVFRQGWPNSDVEVVADELLEQYIDQMAGDLGEVIKRLFGRLQWALSQIRRLQEVASNKGALEADEEALRARCERLVKKLRGDQVRRRADREGVDDTNTYGVLAAEGFLPGYGLDTGSVTTTHEAPRYATDIKDWELRRSTVLALREYVPGNLVYANGNKFVPRRFHLEAEEPLVFAVDVAAESVQEVGVGSATAGPSSMSTARVMGVPMCDVDAPHQSFISDDEDYRFQMGMAVFGQEQGRHGGGEAWNWGTQSIHLYKGMHLRLVNTGPASKVRGEGPLGFPVCRVCGQSRSPMSGQAELDRFAEFHMDRCGQPIANIAFYSDVVADGLNFPLCADKTQAYSILEALRHGAAEVLDMELSDLQILTLGHPGEEQVDGLLYDPMPGGSGLLEQIVERWGEVVSAALDIVSNCSSSCQTSCIDCLQNFRNAFYHDSLDRHLSEQCLREWSEDLEHSHTIPSLLPNATQTKEPVNPPEQTLGAMLEAAGFINFETERPIKLAGGIVTRPDIYFDEPENDVYEGVCIYLDGMSGHLHGNAETRAKDLQIRTELRNKDYAVIEIQYQELFDLEVMMDMMARIGRALVGRSRAKELKEDTSWFVGSDKSPSSETGAEEAAEWAEILQLVDPLWKTFASRMMELELPPPTDVDVDLVDEEGKVTGEVAPFVWKRDGQADLAVLARTEVKETDPLPVRGSYIVVYADHSSLVDEAMEALREALRSDSQ